MNKSYVVVGAVVVVLLVLGGAAFAFKHEIRTALMGSSVPTTPVEQNVPVTPTSTETAPQVVVNEVDYDGTAFTPNSLTVKVGSAVKFVNKSSEPVWVASNPHPTHTDYPEFDQLSVGDSYTFTFAKVGTWGYHNHRNHLVGGQVVVTE